MLWHGAVALAVNQPRKEDEAYEILGLGLTSSIRQDSPTVWYFQCISFYVLPTRPFLINLSDLVLLSKVSHNLSSL